MKISVASGKGGTGKTTIATNLALTLQDVQYIEFLKIKEEGEYVYKKRG